MAKPRASISRVVSTGEREPATDDDVQTDLVRAWNVYSSRLQSSQYLQKSAQSTLPAPLRDNLFLLTTVPQASSLVSPHFNDGHVSPGQSRTFIRPAERFLKISPGVNDRRLNEQQFHHTSPDDDLGMNDDSDLEQELSSGHRRQQSSSFAIGDKEAVCDFLLDRFRRMQQIPVKKIAKAWIRGICPKKQAVFPYSNAKQKAAQEDARYQAGQEDSKHMAPQEEEKIPPWWPIDKCQFREPDHISRRERNDLCLHLLRLRPSAEQLKEWNGKLMPANTVHVREGWTRFLISLAPVSILEELREENEVKARRRRDLLQQLYEVAQMEEDFEMDGCDATDRYFYTDPDEGGSTTKSKRPRSPSSNTNASSASMKRRSGRPTKRHHDGFDHGPNEAAITSSFESCLPVDGDMDTDTEPSSDVDTLFMANLAVSRKERVAPTANGQNGRFPPKTRAGVQGPSLHQADVKPQVSWRAADESNSLNTNNGFSADMTMFHRPAGPVPGSGPFMPEHQNLTWTIPGAGCPPLQLSGQDISISAFTAHQMPQPHFDSVPQTPWSSLASGQTTNGAYSMPPPAMDVAMMAPPPPPPPPGPPTQQHQQQQHQSMPQQIQGAQPAAMHGSHQEYYTMQPHQATVMQLQQVNPRQQQGWPDYPPGHSFQTQFFQGYDRNMAE